MVAYKASAVGARDSRRRRHAVPEARAAAGAGCDPRASPGLER